MKTIEIIEVLKKYPLFGPNDLSKILNKNTAYLKVLVYRLRKQKRLYKIERGKYTVYNDPFIFASLISTPSYISLWSAFRHYNFTDQLPRDIFVMVPNSRKPLKFNDIKINFIKIKNFFGFKKQRYMDFDIFLAEPEKAIIDSLITRKVPFNEVTKAIKDEGVNKEKLAEYAIMTKNKSLIKRIGFLLEENGFKFKSLEEFIDNNYIPLDFSLRKKGIKNNKWKIVDNRK